MSLLLSTSPESSYFYANALRAVALSSAVSRSLLELAVKVRIDREMLLFNFIQNLSCNNGLPACLCWLLTTV